MVYCLGITNLIRDLARPKAIPIHRQKHALNNIDDPITDGHDMNENTKNPALPLSIYYVRHINLLPSVFLLFSRQINPTLQACSLVAIGFIRRIRLIESGSWRRGVAVVL